MFNQTEAILSQYEMEIHEVTKGRGAYICDTNQGMKLLVEFRGSNEKGEFLKKLLEQLNLHGFQVEQIVENKNGAAVSEDEGTGERFLLKDYVEGVELNVSNQNEVYGAARELARLHKAIMGLELMIPDKIKNISESVVDVRKRHYRELIKTRNYIRGKKKKNEFEQIYMRQYMPMLDAAEKSIQILQEQEDKGVEYICCHGDYNQHNVIWSNGCWRIIHFENFVYSWQMVDLANFLRKMLEKNDWDENFGIGLLRSYQKETQLSQDKCWQLYGLLLFPEKFWKITNHYMNSRKAWISERDIEKLKKVVVQEEVRLKFMENLFSILTE